MPSSRCSGGSLAVCNRRRWASDRLDAGAGGPRRDGARSEHSEGIIDLLAQSETAEIALLLKEKDGATRLSVRTKPGGVDATALCGTWGGGGHPRAAGDALPLLPLAEAVGAVLPVAERYARAVSR